MRNLGSRRSEKLGPGPRNASAMRALWDNLRGWSGRAEAAPFHSNYTRLLGKSFCRQVAGREFSSAFDVFSSSNEKWRVEHSKYMRRHIAHGLIPNGWLRFNSAEQRHITTRLASPCVEQWLSSVLHLPAMEPMNMSLCACGKNSQNYAAA